jgi:spore coat protein U-like protein
MKMLRLACLAALVLVTRTVAAQPAAGVSCTTIAPSSVSGTYTPTAALNLTGSISLTCTRNAGPKNRDLWLGIDNGPGTPARNLDRVGGGTSLPYAIYRLPGNTGSWTTGPGQPPTSAAAGGTVVPLNFNPSDNISLTLNYYLQILANNYVMAGNYSDNPVTLTVRLDSETGTVIGTASFVPAIRMPDFCRLSTPPGNMALSYTSFSGVAALASTTFGVQCLRATPYTLALDATSGSALGLTYTLGLNSSGGSGSGLEQTYTINGSIAAGQSGACALASCSATQARTLTITY